MVKRKSKKGGVSKDDDAMSDEDEAVGEEAEVSGDPMESRAAFKAYLLNVLISNELDQGRASKMEILDFLTLLNCMNQAGIHFK